MHPVLLSFLPLVEPRYAIFLCKDLACTLSIAFLSPLLLSLILPLGIEIFDRVGRRLFGRLWERYVESARRRVRRAVGPFGKLGITLFVALPLPFTGIYTGAIGAYFLGYEPRELVLPLFLGGVLSCLPGLLIA